MKEEDEEVKEDGDDEEDGEDEEGGEDGKDMAAGGALTPQRPKAKRFQPCSHLVVHTAIGPIPISQCKVAAS